jgi:hypothetical protein
MFARHCLNRLHWGRQALELSALSRAVSAPRPQMRAVARSAAVRSLTGHAWPLDVPERSQTGRDIVLLVA